MDFLDPKRKLAHRRRLLIGYLLMAVALAMATWLLLINARGFWYDRKTGDFIQNGTVFVDSTPGGSSVELDGVVQGNKTATRLALPGGKQYTIKLTNDGYRDWTRTFSLEGAQIERITYPLLIPKELTVADLQLYAASPGISTQSPDRRWLLVQQPTAQPGFDRYDLNNPSASPAPLALPASVLADASKPSVLTAIEWASDNRHVLIRRDYAGKSDFIMLDTENVAASVNINTLFAITPSHVHLRDKKSDQLYVYTADGGLLRSANTKDSTLSAPLLSGVLAYKTYGSDVILFVTKESAETGKVNFRIRENDKASYLLKEIPESTQYIMDVSEYDGTPYYVVGSVNADALFVYRDPMSILKDQNAKPLVVTQVLRMTAPHFVSFSTSNQFIALQSANDLTVLDLENDRQFKLTLKHPIADTYRLEWIDGHRFVLVDGGVSYMLDFDGSNEQPLIPTINNPYFAPDFKSVFALAPSASVAGRFAFTQASLVKK